MVYIVDVSTMESSLQEDEGGRGGDFIRPLGTINCHLSLSQMGGWQFSHFFFGGRGDNRVFSTGNGGIPSLTSQKLLIPPAGKGLPRRLPPPNSYCPHQRFIPPNPLNSGLDKLHAQWWACTQCAWKEVFACTKLCAHKSIKTLLISNWMLFKVVTCSCVWEQIMFHTTRSSIHNYFHLRSCH